MKIELSEVEEAIYVEKMAYNYDLDAHENIYCQIKAFKAGFNAHKELVKDKLFTLEKVKDIIFQARTFKSDWLDEFYSLDEEAANNEYNPCFKYTEEELIQLLFN